MNIKDMLKPLLIALMSLGALSAAADEQLIEPAADASAFTPACPMPSRVVARAVPSGEWNAIGTGKWYDDLFSYFQVVSPGDMWEIEIEQSAKNPAWYRMLPYGPGTPVANMLDDDDTTNYVYLDTSDPEKVYIPDFKPFGVYTFTQFTDDNGWLDGTPEYMLYGKLEDGIVTFPAEAFGFRTPGEPWTRINLSGKTRIALPGSNPADFTLKAECPFCVDEEGNVRISITVGEDIATVKYTLLQGEYFAEGNNVAAVIAKGADLKGTALRATPHERTMFSLLLVGIGHDGNAVASTECHFFGPDSADPDTWQTAGEAMLTESIFVPLYSNLTAETLIVPYEESVEHPGRIRLVDPYSVHGFNPTVDHKHSHYLYIDASANAAVYIEPSPLGVDFGGGESAVWSWAGRYVEYGMASEAYNEGFFGTRSGNVITMPDNTLLVGEKGYAGGSFTTTGKGFRVSLRPNVSGIESVTTAPAESPAEYYRLDGTRLLTEPTAPGLYIRRQGPTTEKIVIR